MSLREVRTPHLFCLCDDFDTLGVIFFKLIYTTGYCLPDLFLCSNNVYFAKKLALFQELGARKSEVQGDAVVSNKGNALRVHCNKGEL
ncbi:hypothetical protein NC652_036539 [Populus alba x Populus x berolinensis]|nr:hypothetical protein NC652_036539 [Populus alba x Populus x berolinensis]